MLGDISPTQAKLAVSMPSRFVEVARPVEEGVAWASSLPNTLRTNVGSFLPPVSFEVILVRLCGLYDKFLNLRLVSDTYTLVDNALSRFPPADQQTKCFLAAALLAVVLRWLFVLVVSRSILANYGATKMMHKEM